MRLQPPTPAPAFSVTSLEGETWTLETFRGRRLWLVLSRFAACPWCSLRVDLLSRRYPEVKAAGVELLVVFPSPDERIRKYVMKYEPPFLVAADPETAAFDAYASERSKLGAFRSMLDVPKTIRALKRSGGPAPKEDIDGPQDRMPSEFLIGPDGHLEDVHYGASLDDGFAVERVVAWGRSSSRDQRS